MTASSPASAPLPSARLRLFVGGVVVVSVSYTAGFFLSPNDATTDFYSAAASLIPLMVITLAVDGRLFALPSVWRSHGDVKIVGSCLVLGGAVIVRAAPLAILGIAELMALHPLATGDPKDGNPRFIYAAAVAAFVGFGLLAICGRVGEGAE
jgi:Na+-driven multidrug efflux pump